MVAILKYYCTLLLLLYYYYYKLQATCSCLQSRTHCLMFLVLLYVLHLFPPKPSAPPPFQSLIRQRINRQHTHLPYCTLAILVRITFTITAVEGFRRTSDARLKCFTALLHSSSLKKNCVFNKIKFLITPYEFLTFLRSI